ncbi:MAG: R3H domain-containing nucleic acid-binding protein [Candidatus Daviesbacteria bacterium]|nr:R3H domain-containing nucleic acid-binding protein [Candidatus Daviesbacteria bacterium]
MENQLSEILDNLLGMLLLEGSYEIEEQDESFTVSIETKDAGRLIGSRGESLDGLQLLVNQMVFRKMETAEGQKRIVIDVEGWRKQKEEELASSAKSWGAQVLESKSELELEPMSPWQRRIVHMVISEMPGLSSESAGEGRDRHIVIKIKTDAEVKKD